MAEQAGRLEVEVVAQLDGFAEKLRAGVDRAAAGVKAKIGVEIDTAGLRQRLELVVKEASAGVNAKVGVKFDNNAIRNELERALEEAVGEGNVKVGVHTDDHLRTELRADIEEAQLEADRNPIQVPVEEKQGWFQRLRDNWRIKLAKLRSDAESELGGGRRGGGLLGRILGPLSPGTLKIGALVSLIQPLLGVVDSLGAGLTVLAGGITQAAGAAGAGLPMLTALGQGLGTFAISMQGVGSAFSAYAGAIDKLHQGWPLSQEDLVALDHALQNISPSARSVVIQLVRMRPAFKDLRKDVQEAFFSKFADQIKPLATSLLPLLDRQLTKTGSVIGNVTRRFAKFMQTKGFRKDLDTIMGNNNGILKNLGTAGLNLFKIFTKLAVAAGPLAKHVSEIFAAWTGQKAREAEQNVGRLTDFFNRAGDRFGQIYRTLRDFGAALVNIGSIALGVDDSLGDQGVFGSMERVARQFRAWTDSAKGKNTIKQYFEDMIPIVTEVGHLVREAFDGLVRHGADNPQGLLGALKSLEKIGPVIGGFLDHISAVLGPKLIGAISSFVEAFGALAAGKADAFSKPIIMVLDALTGIANFITEHKMLADSLGYLLGAIVAFKVLHTAAKFTGILSLTSALGGLFRTVRGGGGLRGILSALSGGRIGGSRVGGVTSSVLGQLVYWREPLPVYVVGGAGIPGAGGKPGGGAPVILGGGAAGEGAGAASKGGLLSRLKSGIGKLGRGAGRLLGGAGTGLLIYGLGDMVGNQVGGQGGSYIKSGATGAALGAAIGSVIPGIGTAIGAGIGGGIGVAVKGLKDLFGGLSNPYTKDNATPGGKDLIKFQTHGRAIINGFTKDILKGGDAWRKYQAQTIKAALAHTSLLTSAKQAGLTEKDLVKAVVGSNDTYQRVIGTLKESGVVTDDQIVALQQLRDQHIAGRTKAENYADATGKVVRAEVKSVSETALLTGKFGDLNTAHLTGKQSAGVFRQKLDDLSDAIDANGRSLDGNTSYGQQNILAIKNAASQALAHAQAVYQQTGSLHKADEALRDDKHKLIEQASQLGLNKKAVRRLVDQVYDLHKAPGSKKITVNVDQARRRLNSFNGFFDNFMAQIAGKVANFPTPFEVSGTTIGGLLVVPGNVNVFNSSSGDGSGSRRRRRHHRSSSSSDGAGYPNVNGVPIIGTNAKGGRPSLRGANLVGEDGPELFVPDRPGSIVPAVRTRIMLNRLRAAASSVRGLGEVHQVGGGTHVVFEDGAIRVTNPVPEKASTSIEKRVRAIGEFGLFGGGA